SLVENSFIQYRAVVSLFQPVVQMAKDEWETEFALDDQFIKDNPDVALQYLIAELGWPSIGRGVIWGMAGLGAAAGAVPLGVSALAWGTIAFGMGYSASVWTEIWSTLEAENFSPNK